MQDYNDDDSGGLYLSCEIVIHQILLHINIKIASVRISRILLLTSLFVARENYFKNAFNHFKIIAAGGIFHVNNS